MTPEASRIPDILRRRQSEILNDWMRQVMSTGALRGGAIREDELREQCRTFVSLLTDAAQSGAEDIMSPPWSAVREFLAGLARSRAAARQSSSETAKFVFSLKLPLFAQLRQEYGNDVAGLGSETWTTTVLLDSLGLWTTELYQKAREDVIARQQQELMELSTPVVKLWHGVLALPLIGTLDSARTQVVMESLLQQIVNTGASIAIIDITGVPTVDTLVAQHLLKTVAAARLMGADCIISGIRPQIAQTIVHLGVVLGDVITKATLADAFLVALQRSGAIITRAAGGSSAVE
jgi:rsbT co-antagonist protein RsbR